MASLICTDPTDTCGKKIVHPDCSKDSYDAGLGPGRNHVIQVKWVSNPDPLAPLPDVWVYVDGYKPMRLDQFSDGQTYSFNWDMRKSLQAGTVRFGLLFPAVSGDQPQSEALLLNEVENTTYLTDRIEMTFKHARNIPAAAPFAEVAEVQDPDAPCVGIDNTYGICLYDCCPVDCTKPYDNTVFCWETHNESPFSVSAANDPGMAKQAFIAGEAGVQPIRGIALTRSGDAFDQDMKLLYSAQQWVMVWDFELGRLVDFFPKEWLRYGAAFYYQNSTLRKEIKAGFSNRKPYYIEIVDLGLVNGPQGSYLLDLDANGQRTHNWDVPSRILGLAQEGQQLPPAGFGLPKPVSGNALYNEFNHLSVDAYRQVSDDAAPALRERFFKDRELFLNHTTKQKHHDQIMFLTKEVAERTLRALQDMIENGRQLVDTFNPDAQNGFGYYMIAILNIISQKMLRAKADGKIPNFGNFQLEADEETSADWARYIYGELRRLVEITKIDKKDFQTTMLEALKDFDPTDPTSILKSIQSKIDPALLKQEYDIAANGRIAAGGGVTDPDTKTENQIRGLTPTKPVRL